MRNKWRPGGGKEKGHLKRERDLCRAIQTNNLLEEEKGVGDL